MKHAKSLAKIMFVAFLIVFSVAYVSVGAVSFTIKNTYLTLMVDGTVKVVQNIVAENPPVEVSLKLLGEPLIIEVVSGEVKVPVEVNDLTAKFTAFERSNTLTYYTADLTEKKGEEWILHYICNQTTYVILPEEALVYSIEPSNFEISLENGKVVLIMPPGEVRISYILIPITLEKTETPPQPSRTPTPTTYASPLDYLLYIILALIAIFLMFMVFRRLISSKTSFIELDERDKLIVDVIRRLGEAPAQKIMEETGIPKTPLYRRLKKLEKAGVIESVLRSGKTYYRVKK